MENYYFKLSWCISINKNRAYVLLQLCTVSIFCIFVCMMGYEPASFD